MHRIAGVEVRVDRSWYVIAALVAWSFWARFDATHSFAGALLMAVAASAVFFASILAHEVAHALEARHRGIEVRSITLYLFGGATETASESRRPVDEFAVTAVGPWTSLVLGCACGLIAYAASRAGSWASPAGEVAAALAWLNLVLAFFNLLPGAPLDGGRMLDSLAWRLTGDRVRARRLSTGAGRVLGFLLIALGIVVSLSSADGLLDGVWLAFVGWFLFHAATAERSRAAVPPAPKPEPEPRP